MISIALLQLGTSALLAFNNWPAPPSTFGAKVDGKALTGNPGSNNCLLMMNALNVGANMADGSYVTVEIMPAAFPKLPVTLSASGGSLEKYAKIFYYPKGIKDAMNMYTSVGSTGTVTITRYNAAARTIAGTFSGQLVRGPGSKATVKTVQLTDGRFDVTFNKM
ncbi:hypothetical protein [Hymenobacter koreensis]|uniref:Lipocalin-like domain-containing protein n=1 Tax=Hymenobacter koreensis TaxID=1084523 RepID=A0ABP8IUK3_9BACT